MGATLRSQPLPPSEAAVLDWTLTFGVFYSSKVARSGSLDVQHFGLFVICGSAQVAETWAAIRLWADHPGGRCGTPHDT